MEVESKVSFEEPVKGSMRNLVSDFEKQNEELELQYNNGDIEESEYLEEIKNNEKTTIEKANELNKKYESILTILKEESGKNNLFLDIGDIKHYEISKIEEAILPSEYIDVYKKSDVDFEEPLFQIRVSDHARSAIQNQKYGIQDLNFYTYEKNSSIKKEFQDKISKQKLFVE